MSIETRKKDTDQDQGQPDASSNEVEIRKLALEERRLKQEADWKLAEFQQKEKELQLQRDQFEESKQQAERSRFVVFGREVPGVAVAVLVAVVTAIGGWIGGYLQGGQNLQLEREKAKAELILNAVKTGNQDAAGKNLLFLLKVGLIDDPQDKLRNLVEDKKSPVLPASVGSRDSGWVDAWSYNAELTGPNKDRVLITVDTRPSTPGTRLTVPKVSVDFINQAGKTVGTKEYAITTGANDRLYGGRVYRKVFPVPPGLSNKHISRAVSSDLNNW